MYTHIYVQHIYMLCCGGVGFSSFSTLYFWAHGKWSTEMFGGH